MTAKVSTAPEVQPQIAEALAKGDNTISSIEKIKNDIFGALDELEIRLANVSQPERSDGASPIDEPAAPPNLVPMANYLHETNNRLELLEREIANIAVRIGDITSRIEI